MDTPIKSLSLRTFFVTAVDGRRFVERAMTPEAAKRNVDADRVHSCGWTGKTRLVEHGVCVASVTGGIL